MAEHDPWLDQAASPRPGEALDTAALSAYLQQQLGWEGELEVAQFPRGHSNLTYLLRMGDRDLVLRRPPFGARVQSGHDMAREFKVLSHLWSVYDKVPEPLHLCEDPAILGASFYLMQRVQGVILRPHMPEAMRPAPALMARIAQGLVATLAELHQLDLRAAGLQAWGRPQGYVQRQVEGWTRRYHHAQTDELPDMQALATWLQGHLPSDEAATLIHNDFKYDNLVLAPGDWSQVMAVLDWEMATVGHPLMDLGTSLAYWVEPTDPPLMQQLALSPTLLPGNPGRVELAHRYAQASGRAVDQLVFYYAFGLFKVAVIAQQIYARYRAGHTQDPRFKSLIQAVRMCAQMGLQAVQKGRIDRLFEA